MQSDKKDIKKDNKNEKTQDKKSKQVKYNILKFKERYFEYYDDVKSPSKGREDW